MNIEKQLKEILDSNNITLDPSKDEQQLVEKDVLDVLLSTAELTLNDTVLEVGAGCGNITEALAIKCKKVIAVEKNEKFLGCLQKRMKPYHNIEIILGDALKIRFPAFNKLVSNIPYSICEPFFHKLTKYTFNVASVILSSSFVEIITAKKSNKKYSRLSFIAKLFFDIKRVTDVPRESYYPKPRKMTTIVKITPNQLTDLEDIVLKETLIQNDKKLKNALREALIVASLTHNAPSTKRCARKAIKKLNLNTMLQEKKVSRLSKVDLKYLRSTLTKL